MRPAAFPSMIAAAAFRRLQKGAFVTRTSLSVACTVVSLGFTVASAQAQTASRAWVSGKGTDAAGCGGVTTPCRTPQYAHDNIVAAGGEIDILDPAGYGAITISKAISLVNDGVGTAGMLALSAGNAITITAGSSDAIQLRGLTIEGSGVGHNGIVFNAGGSLTVANCVVQNFNGEGISIQPSSGSISFVITNTIVSNIGNSGIIYNPSGGSPNARGTIDHAVTTNNFYGIYINMNGGIGGAMTVAISNSVASNNAVTGITVGSAGGPVKATIENSSASNNADGIDVGSSVAAAVNVTIENSSASNNSTNGILLGSTSSVTPRVMVRNSLVSNNQNGVVSNSGGIILIAHSAVTGNSSAGALLNGGPIFSYGDNNIDGNLNQVAGGALTPISTR
jgi:parallel beta helix pectate lyase-like protein